MKLNKLTTAVVALAAAALLGGSAHATNASITSGDLLIGFEDPNQNASNDYVADIGSASLYLNKTAPVSVNISEANLSADFGTGWNTNPTSGNANLLEWGIVGNDQSETVQTANTHTVFFTQGEQTGGTPSTNPGVVTSGNGGTVSNDIKTFESTGGYKGLVVVSGAGEAVGVNESVSATNSWSSFSPSDGSGFSLVNGAEQPGTGANDGPTDSYLDLFEAIPGTSTTLLGTFNLSWNGNTADDAVLTFDPVATPEPSAYALGLTALMLFAVLKRRKSIAKQA